MVKRVFSIILTLVILAVVGVAIYGFVFDKTIPTEWAATPIAEVKEAKLLNDDKMPSMKVNYEHIVYSEEDGNTVSYYSTKYYRELKNKSTKEAEGYEIIAIDYDDKGKAGEKVVTKYYIEDGKYYRESGTTKTEITNFDEVGMFCILVVDYYNEELKIQEDIIDLIDNHFENVTQRGLNVTLHMKKNVDNKHLRCDITYNFVTKKIAKIESYTDTYVNDVLSDTVHHYVEF